jgi:hypothetical protein
MATQMIRMDSKRIIVVVALILIIAAASAIVVHQNYVSMHPSGPSPSLSILILAPKTYPSVDNSCLGASNALNNNACLLTAAQTSDLIIAEIGTGSATSTISSISAAGLSWSLYAHYTRTGTSPKSLFVYYAFASSVLSSDNVTVKYTSAGTNGLLVIAVNNYDRANPFDPSKSPATSSSSGATKIDVYPVNTVNSNELVFGMFAIASAPTVTTGTGFTALSYSGHPTVYAEWQQISAPVSNFNVTASVSATEPYLGTAFGVESAPVTTTSTTSTTISTTTSASSISSSSSTSTSSTTSTSVSISSSTSLSVTSSSTGNACFVNGYDSGITVINSIYWECAATLQGSQSIKQNIFRSSELFGSFTITVNSSQMITVIVAENGVVVFTKTGTSISYSDSVTQNEPMYITVSNSESSATSYSLGIDWTDV